MDTPAQHRKAQAKYQATDKQKKVRASRNKARSIMEKRGLVHKGDGKDVDHKNGNPMQTTLKNLRVLSRHRNRSYPRTPGGHKKHPGV